MDQIVLAVDPGRDKCGLALVSPGRILFRAVVPAAEIGLTCHYLLQQHPLAELIVGCGTGSADVVAAIKHVLPDVSVTVVPERDSTLRARARYFANEPLTLWQRLLPAGLRLPPRPVDDYAAVVLAEDYLAGTTNDS